MEWIKASFVKLKCSEFMTETEHFNNNTTLLILNEELRTRKFYLVLKFIYSKYKDLIYNQQILKEIENYIEMYEISKSIKSFKSGEDLLNFCVTLEFKIYENYLFQHIKSIDEFVNRENIINVIVIDMESHVKNQYICYMKE
jgi:hypothetical protein